MPIKTQLPYMAAAAAPAAALTCAMWAGGYVRMPAQVAAVQSCAGFLLPALAAYLVERRSRARFLLAIGARGAS